MRPFQALFVLGGLALVIVGLNQSRALAIAGLGMIVLAVLGNLAERCHAYAKALHYKETEFHTSPSSTIEGPRLAPPTSPPTLQTYLLRLSLPRY